MSSQQGEDEGRAGHDAEFAECHAEASPCSHHIMLACMHTHTHARSHAHNAFSVHGTFNIGFVWTVCQSAEFPGGLMSSCLPCQRMNMIKVELESGSKGLNAVFAHRRFKSLLSSLKFLC